MHLMAPLAAGSPNLQIEADFLPNEKTRFLDDDLSSTLKTTRFVATERHGWKR